MLTHLRERRKPGTKSRQIDSKGPGSPPRECRLRPWQQFLFFVQSSTHERHGAKHQMLCRHVYHISRPLRLCRSAPLAISEACPACEVATAVRSTHLQQPQKWFTYVRSFNEVNQDTSLLEDRVDHLRPDLAPGHDVQPSRSDIPGSRTHTHIFFNHVPVFAAAKRVEDHQHALQLLPPWKITGGMLV